MRWKGSHLTYCLNIHPGETWKESVAAIRTYAAAVKERVSPDRPFGLGLRLSARAASELRPHVPAFRDYLAGAGMYVFTINGFPYGQFHGTRVKELAYEPDWSRPERREYTEVLAWILAALLPEGVDGSISTVPVAYGKALPAEAVDSLVRTAEALARIEAQTGRTIVLALEPEPDCLIETTDEAVRFWGELRSRAGTEVLRFLGVCLDTCHAAVEFESPADSICRLRAAGIPVPKIQISSALVVPPGADPVELLAPFADEVYLHQTRVLSNGQLLRFSDLPEALRENPHGEWRVHFHVPLHFSGGGGLETTARLLDAAFLSEALAPDRHLEIETYSFDVLPEPRGDVVDSIASEFARLFEARRQAMISE